MVGLGGKLAVEAEEALLIWGERLYILSGSSCGAARSRTEITYADVNLVLLVGVHLEFVFLRAGMLHRERDR